MKDGILTWFTYAYANMNQTKQMLIMLIGS